MSRTTLASLLEVGAKERYVDHTIRRLEEMTIREARKGLFDVIMQEIKCHQKIKTFYIGVCTGKDSGTQNIFSCHIEEDQGRNGLVALAVVTKDSIPAECQVDEYITHPIDYALILKKRLIEQFKQIKDKRLCRKRSIPDTTDKVDAYVLYMTFELEGNGYVLDGGLIIENETIATACLRVYEKIENNVKEIEEKNMQKN